MADLKAMADFEPGETVRLKSGGPRMTVEQTGDDAFGQDTVWCVWFEQVGNRQEVKRATFPPVALEKDHRPPA
jgi:uncharacterized protein YodC (DUF2158 family)